MKNDLARAFDLGTDVNTTLINVSENKTYRIDCADGRCFALRLARPGYHTPAEFASEMAWLQALHEMQVVRVAQPLKGLNGDFLQTVKGQNALLFEWVQGDEPKITDDLMGLAEQLGGLAARLHTHALHWPRPTSFTRPKWDFDAALGAEQRWGDWRKGLGVTPAMVPLLARAVAKVEADLKAYGTAQQRFNLIHGDLRLANLLRDGSNLTVIDFDDCGFGWLMYDAATMISFHEHEPQAAEMIRHWKAGYRKHRPLTLADEKAIETLIIFRRILLTAWLGTHSEIDLARQVKGSFAGQTCDLCETYLVSK